MRGSVIATKDAILPAAVGVDIGCFTGDTLVPLADGKSYSLQALASSQREIIVYSCTQTGKIVPAKATAKLTRRNQLLLKVVLDNSEEIKCTPDHRFMLRDGSYREARDLKPGTSLMPFYSQIDKDGYTLIQQPYSGRWQKADEIISASDIPASDIPTSEWLKSQFSGTVPSFPGQRTVIDHHIDHHNVEPAEHRSSNLVGGANHKVVKILPLQERQDVYCLTVPEYHNFALTAGVFVHNCGMSAIKTPFVAEQLEGKLKKIRLEIEAAIPVGFNENKDIEKPVVNWQGWRDFKELHPGVQRLDGKSMKQLGSLGGGNHFIELCLDTENQVWLMLHSGSRHIGNQLGDILPH
ncbi:RtcB family protein [Moorena sp. SIO1F2]|uniref:RtcB family protein n=1 Tax=Moorena sp. SIO1F2 TaxID=2607819 RepID=UPI00345B7AA4